MNPFIQDAVSSIEALLSYRYIVAESPEHHLKYILMSNGEGMGAYWHSMEDIGRYFPRDVLSRQDVVITAVNNGMKVYCTNDFTELLNWMG